MRSLLPFALLLTIHNVQDVGRPALSTVNFRWSRVGCRRRWHQHEAAAAHKETAHYLKWRDAVADAMAQPREGNGVNLLSAPSSAKTSEESETAVFRRALAAGSVAEAIALLQDQAPRTFLIHGRAIEENLKTHFGRERDRQRNDRQQRSTMIL